MKRYVDVLGSASHSFHGAKRATEIVAALAPPPRSDLTIGAAAAVAKKDDSDSAGKIALELTPGVVAGAAGAFAWKSHRVLGFLAGHAIGASAVPFLRNEGNDRRAALCQLGVEGAGVAGALYFGRKSTPKAILGWVGGLIAGAVATSFVQGSPMNVAYNKAKASEEKAA